MEAAVGNHSLGYILSLLDAKEAGRTAELSSQWRSHVHPHTNIICFEEPVRDSDSESDDNHIDDDLRFSDAVSGAILDRTRPGGALPASALRVYMQRYHHLYDNQAVDTWLFYALRLAADSLEICLCLGRVPDCKHPYSAALFDSEDDIAGDGNQAPDLMDMDMEPCMDDDTGSISDTGTITPPPLPKLYIVPPHVLRCEILRFLRIGPCKLSPPAQIRLPALEILHVTQPSDSQEDLQRLISSCPNLLDLTLEGCRKLSTLSLVNNNRLVRLVIRCCNSLSNVELSNIHFSQLECFEFRGEIKVDISSMFGVQGRSFASVTQCTIDVCARCQRFALPLAEVHALASFTQMFEWSRFLKLSSRDMAMPFEKLPCFLNLQHLQLSGSLNPFTVTVMSQVLPQAPNLESLTVFFEVLPQPNFHHKDKDNYATLDSYEVPSCLEKSLKILYLLNLQGDKSQAQLVKYLVRNSPVLEKIYCLFEGVHQEAMEEQIKEWVVKKQDMVQFQPHWIDKRVQEEVQTPVSSKVVSKVFRVLDLTGIADI